MTTDSSGSEGTGRPVGSVRIEGVNVAHLAVFAPNWLGDAVMALPAIADVQRGAPAMPVTIVARPTIAPLFSLLPGLGEPVVLPRERAGRAAAIAALKGRSCSAALLLPNSLNSALTAWRADIPARWGYRTDCRGPLLTRAVERPEHVHQAEYYQHLVRELGFESGPGEPRIAVPPEAVGEGRRLLTSAGWDGRVDLVAVAPGAAAGGAKRWPLASFARLVEALAGDQVGVVLIGSAADAAVADELVGMLDERGTAAVNLVGRTDLPALAGALAHCRSLVTNDSGAMHLAAAIGVRVTAMFGPTDEGATRPLGTGHAVLIHPTWCRPCMLRECPLDHRCMRGIGVEAVLAAARRAR